MALQAIETHYNGYRFRSRLEARWAVFFDTLGIQWEYEKQGFELPSGRYLPDFWFPNQKFWVEIKGQEPNSAECRLAGELAFLSGFDVYIFHGEIPPPGDLYGHFHETQSAGKFFAGEGFTIFYDEHGWCELKCDEISSLAVSALCAFSNSFHDIQSATEGKSERVYVTHKQLQRHIDPDVYPEIKSVFDRIGIKETSRLYAISSPTNGGFDSPFAWTECPGCGRIGIGFSGWSERVCNCPAAYKTGYDSDRLIAAYTAARSARFEHGETPKVQRGRPRKG